MKKSRRELAREIIANLRRGMNRPPLDASQRKDLPAVHAYAFDPFHFDPLQEIRSVADFAFITSLTKTTFRVHCPHFNVQRLMR
jgi:hypothetical protein